LYGHTYREHLDTPFCEAEDTDALHGTYFTSSLIERFLSSGN